MRISHADQGVRLRSLITVTLAAGDQTWNLICKAWNIYEMAEAGKNVCTLDNNAAAGTTRVGGKPEQTPTQKTRIRVWGNPHPWIQKGLK